MHDIVEVLQSDIPLSFAVRHSEGLEGEGGTKNMAPHKTIIHPIAASWIRHKGVDDGPAIGFSELGCLNCAADVLCVGGIIDITHLGTLRE